jgi:hypothetical protein
VRLYDRLFKAANPMEAGDQFLKHLNPNSLEVLKECRVEPSMGNAAPGSAMVFDYVYQAVLDGLQKQSEISSMQRYRFMTGEGLTFGIPEGTAGSFLQGRGFQQLKDVTTDELKATYFAGRNVRRKVAGGYGIVIGRV